MHPHARKNPPGRRYRPGQLRSIHRLRPSMLEEVIVTAQKRAESLQDVPISVSAIQGDKVKDAGIPNMAALADYVPNLHIAEAPVNTQISICAGWAPATTGASSSRWGCTSTASIWAAAASTAGP